MPASEIGPEEDNRGHERKIVGIIIGSTVAIISGIISWKLWEQGRPLKLIDECFKDTWTLSEVQRCIHISLLCAQQHPRDRPSMPTVVLMLGSEVHMSPKFPTFFIGEPSEGISSSCTKIEISVTSAGC
ncbi:hypothetical protein VNO78_13712 [Psophocarpus tetragonolobus]|uniref:Uncharacterized protein n=1 Tax=Psophocarpus tetragonolobus TaxID=3891 RepID=A0AAN9SZ61_PSOTE